MNVRIYLFGIYFWCHETTKMSLCARFILGIISLCHTVIALSGTLNDVAGEIDATPIRSSLSEYIHEIGFSQSITVEGGYPIVDIESEYQDIAVYQTPHFGKVLVLDDVVQITERDANSYNEMMAHVPMMVHANPRRILVIGGGDGHVVSEVLKHDSVILVDHVDLDEEVVKVCREHFAWGKAWDDERVTLHVADGAAFVAKAPANYYDVIIQDSSDPYFMNNEGIIVDLPSGVLFTMKHFKNIIRILSKDGVFNFQAETFNIPSDLKGTCSWRKDALQAGFQSAKYGSLYISSYPTGQIGFLTCQKNTLTEATHDSINNRFEQMVAKGLGTSYYQPSLQKSCFDLPLWVSKAIYSEGEYEEKMVTK